MDRLMTFSLASSVAYVFAYYFNLSLFEYYPMMGEFRFGSAVDPADQTVHLYGWLATAAIVGCVLAYALPKRWAARIPPDALWALAVVLVVAVFMYERRWFF
jgi:hypothetical protein